VVYSNEVLLLKTKIHYGILFAGRPQAGQRPVADLLAAY